jgi:hypothetical protein
MKETKRERKKKEKNFGLKREEIQDEVFRKIKVKEGFHWPIFSLLACD